MPRNKNKKQQFSSAYARIRRDADAKLPHCDICSRGYPTLLSIRHKGRSVLACPTCQKFADTPHPVPVT